MQKVCNEVVINVEKLPHHESTFLINLKIREPLTVACVFSNYLKLKALHTTELQ